MKNKILCDSCDNLATRFYFCIAINCVHICCTVCFNDNIKFFGFSKEITEVEFKLLKILDK